MKIKTDIEIVTGFIGAGKTTFINALLSNTLVEKERVFILQGELGEKNIDDKYIKSRQVAVKSMINTNRVNVEYIRNIIEVYKPHRIIIEQNGIVLLQELIECLNQDDLRKMCCIATIYNILDAETFDLYLSNMGDFILPCIYNSNLILVNNLGNATKQEKDNIKKKIEELNSFAVILEIDDITCLEEKLKNVSIFDRGIFKKLRITIKNYLNKKLKVLNGL